MSNDPSHDPIANLVVKVRDQQTPPHEREHAWRELTRFITVRAGLVGRQFSPSVARTLEDDAVSFVYQRLPAFQSERGAFDSWVQVLLTNLGRDLRRKHRLDIADSRNDNTKPDDAENSDARADYSARIAELRQALNRLGSVAEVAPNGNDYFAILLLELRLRMARRIAASVRAGMEMSASASSVIETFALPWLPSESARRCRLAWETLETVWEAIRGALDRPPYWLGGHSMMELLAARFPNHQPVSEQQWGQWLHKTKTWLQKRATEADAATIFAVLTFGEVRG